MSAAKAKGTWWESSIVKWLISRGHTAVERRALTGSADRGDIAGLAGVVIEAKNHGTLTLKPWMQELQREVDNDGAVLGLLCAKRKGSTSPEDAYWLIDPRHVPMVIRAVQQYQEVRRDEAG
jgi:hypothetical protein